MSMEIKLVQKLRENARLVYRTRDDVIQELLNRAADTIEELYEKVESQNVINKSSCDSTDYICRQDLIKCIYDMDNAVNLFRWRNADKIKNGLKDIIERQPSVDRWFPCNERMPEETDSYLVTTYSSGISAYIADIDHFVYNGHEPDGGYWVNCEDNKEVLAWQPLPPAFEPKEE